MEFLAFGASLYNFFRASMKMTKQVLNMEGSKSNPKTIIIEESKKEEKFHHFDF